MFACGGEYWEPGAGGKRQRRFSFVRPTRGLPYVARDEAAGRRLFGLCEHHSHLYELSGDFRTATLVERSGWACGVGAPSKLVGLRDDIRDELVEASKDPWDA